MRNGPPDEEVRHIRLDHGDGFSVNLHEQTITITLTGPGWGQVRNAQILIALLEAGMDPDAVVGYWKAADHRHMYITFRSPEAARQAQDIGSIRIGDAHGQIKGSERVVDVKLHWVPAWMEEGYLQCIMGMYGQVLWCEREKLDIAGLTFDSGTVNLKIRTTREGEQRIPSILKFHGPAQGTLLVAVRGRPQRCLSCWEHGHVRRYCDRNRNARQDPQARMQSLGPVRQQHNRTATQPKTVATQRLVDVAEDSSQNLISWEEAPTRQEREGGTDADIIPPTQPPPPDRSNLTLLLELAPETEMEAVEIPETQTTIPSSQPEPLDSQTEVDEVRSETDETATLLPTLSSTAPSPTTIPGGTATEDTTNGESIDLPPASLSSTILTTTPSPTPPEDTTTISQVTSPSSPPPLLPSILLRSSLY